MLEKLKSASDYIQSKLGTYTPKTALVLGSGLDSYLEKSEVILEIPYHEIPYFHKVKNHEHKGKLTLCKRKGETILILQGRLHAYEGLEMSDVVFPIRVLSLLGVQNLILTNAAGGITENTCSGDLVLIDDHINFSGKNPLIGPNINELGPRFPDMTKAYNPELKKIFENTSKELDISLKKGIYCSVLGPTYETPAEVNMLKYLGADMVGMSTVHECIAANHMGIKVVGISCITNKAAGIGENKLNHEEILQMGQKLLIRFSDLLDGCLTKINK